MAPTITSMPSIFSLPALCKVTSSFQPEVASIVSATTAAGSVSNEDPQLLPLAWIAKLGAISDTSHLRPFRQEAREHLNAYFGAIEYEGEHSPVDTEAMSHGIARFFSSAQRTEQLNIPHSIKDARVPPLRRWSEQDLVLGMSHEEWMNEIREHEQELAAHGIDALLMRACFADQLSFVHPLWLTFSPFGINSGALCTLGTNHSYFHPTPIAPLIGDALRIGCFGAGLHDEANYFAAMEMRSLSKKEAPHIFGAEVNPQLAFARRLKAVQEKLFGPVAAASYEVREMLALWFRNGDRNGAIHVFDRDPRIARSLTDPSFAVTNAFDASVRNLFPGADALPRELRRYFSLLASGRSVKRASHGSMPSGEELRSWSFEFTPRELSKIHVHELDMVLDPLPKLERFDLSVWLGSHYFFSPTVAFYTLTKILHQTKVGGYVLTDYFTRKRVDSPAVQKLLHALGIGVVAANRNAFVDGAVTSHLLLKRADTENATLLASLLR